MKSKKLSRLRRAKSTRKKIFEQSKYKLSVFRSSKHIYAQVFSPDCKNVLANASTLDADFVSLGIISSNKEAASKVGQLIAQRALAAGIDSVAFDRSGYKYHGRIQELAEAARATGLKF